MPRVAWFLLIVLSRTIAVEGKIIRGKSNPISGPRGAAAAAEAIICNWAITGRSEHCPTTMDVFHRAVVDEEVPMNVLEGNDNLPALEAAALYRSGGSPSDRSATVLLKHSQGRVGIAECAVHP